MRTTFAASSSETTDVIALVFLWRIIFMSPDANELKWNKVLFWSCLEYYSRIDSLTSEMVMLFSLRIDITCPIEWNDFSTRKTHAITIEANIPRICFCCHCRYSVVVVIGEFVSVSSMDCKSSANSLKLRFSSESIDDIAMSSDWVASKINNDAVRVPYFVMNCSIVMT